VDIATAIAFLASKESGFITGVLLDVNGGQAMST
jgi:NAD(P)-dependent dehydrogenase (short-subunit alcohol dehydrogenase family)